MDSFTFNKIAGSALSALLVLVAMDVIVGELYPRGKPYGVEFQEVKIVDIPEEAAAPAQAAAPAADTKPLPVLLAAATPEDGQAGARKCTACHSFEKGGKNAVGPNLYGTMGRAIAGVEGFNYSTALKEKGGEWTFEAMDAWLANPKAFAPGNKMAFAGLSRPEERAAMLVYLRSLSDNPIPLPAAEAAAAPAPAAAAAPAAPAETPAASAPAAEAPKPAADSPAPQAPAAQQAQPTDAQPAPPGPDKPVQAQSGSEQPAKAE